MSRGNPFRRRCYVNIGSFTKFGGEHGWLTWSQLQQFKNLALMLDEECVSHYGI